MKRIDLEQGSPDWLLWRKSRICATDASIICGLYPYKTPRELWLEKKPGFIPEPPNEAMLRGQILEPVARERFIQETGIHVVPACVEHDSHWWMGASLDGISTCGKILLEIKCPGKRNHAFSIEIGVLEYWKAQIQHQLFITGSDVAYFVSYNPDFDPGHQFVLRKVLPDVEFMARMLDAESRFYHINIRSNVEPPDHVNPLYIDAAD